MFFTLFSVIRVDGDKQDPGYLHRAGSCFHHRTWAPRRWPDLGRSALAVPLPLLLRLAVFSRSGPAGGGACLPLHGTPQHLLGGPAAVALSHYAGGFKIYVPVLYQRLLCAILVLYGLALLRFFNYNLLTVSKYQLFHGLGSISARLIGLSLLPLKQLLLLLLLLC